MYTQTHAEMGLHQHKLSTPSPPLSMLPHWLLSHMQGLQCLCNAYVWRGPDFGQPFFQMRTFLVQLYAQQCMRLACVWLGLGALPTLLCGSLRLCIGWQVRLRRLAGVCHHSARWQAVGAIWVHRHGQRDLHARGRVQGCMGVCAGVSLKDVGAGGLLGPRSEICMPVAGLVTPQACKGVSAGSNCPQVLQA